MKEQAGLAALTVSLAFTASLLLGAACAFTGPAKGSSGLTGPEQPVAEGDGKALEPLPTVPEAAAKPAAPVAVQEDSPAKDMELEVPFACGSRVVISQSHGTFSHVGTDRWAWDFRVPEGTPVHAARDGVVRLARSDSVRGGCDRSFGPDSNYVILQHENGLETQYLHFSKVFVSVGQKVKAGTVIGEVGRTGFSCGAHLHFQMQRTREGAWANQSVPARFREIGDPNVDQEVVSANCAAPTAPEEPLQAEAETEPSAAKM